MAANLLEEYLVKIGFDAPLEKLKSFIEFVKSIVIRLQSLDVAFLAAAVSAVKFVQHVVDETEAFRKLGERIGATGDEVETYVNALQLISIPQEQAEGSLTSLSLAIGRAASGMQRTQKIFEQVGVAYKDHNGKIRPTLEVLDELRTKLAGMNRGEAEAFLERLGIGADYAKTLKFSLASLRDEVEQIDKATGNNSSTLFKNAKIAGDAIRRFKKEIQTWKVLFDSAAKASAQKSMPTLAKVFDNIVAKIKLLRDAVTGFIRKMGEGKNYLDPLIRAFGFLVQVGTIAATWLVKFGQWLFTSDSAIATVARSVLFFAAAMKLLNLQFLRSPIFWFIALAVVIVALVEDFQVFLEGGQSLFGSLSNGAKIVYLLVASIVAIIAAMTVWGMVMSAIGMVAGVFGTIAKATRIATLAQWLWNAAMLANPVTWIIIGLIALIAIIVLVVVKFDWFKEKILGIFKVVKDAMDGVLEGVFKVIKAFTGGGKFEGSINAITKPPPMLAGPIASGTSPGISNDNRNQPLIINQKVDMQVTGNNAKEIGQTSADAIENLNGQNLKRYAISGAR